MPWEVPQPMPQPSPEDARSFKAMYLKKTGIEITEGEALDCAARLLQLTWLVMHTPRDAEEKG